MLLLGATLLGCVTNPTQPETPVDPADAPARPLPAPSTAHPAPVATQQPMPATTPATTLPVLVGRRIVDPATGQIIKELADVAAHEVAVPADDPGRYWLGDTLVDVASQALVRTRSPELRLDSARRAVRRFDETDKPRWTTILNEGVGSVRPPDVVADDARVYVAVDSGIAVLDGAGGTLQRVIKGPHDHLMLYAGRIVAVDCASPGSTAKRLLVAYDGATGGLGFSAELPLDEEPETPLVVDGDLLVVGRNYTLLLDPQGAPRLRLQERVAAIRTTPPGWVLVSDQRIFALGGDQKLAWEHPRFTADFVHEAHILELPGGDLLAHNFGRISDSGVELVRLGPQGEQRWRTTVAPAGVSHSKYRHVAHVLVRGDELVVVSQGSYASFLEVVDAGTGASKRRFAL